MNQLDLSPGMTMYITCVFIIILLKFIGVAIQTKFATISVACQTDLSGNVT